MLFPVSWFNWHDSTVAFFGFVFNLLLILTVLKRTSSAFKSYGYMVLVYSINDTIYSLVSMSCRRVIELKNGSLFHMGYGLEPISPHWFAIIIEFLNEVVCMQATVIIPTQYYFRYILISKTREPTIRLLISLTLFGLTNSIIFGLSDVSSNLKAATRGHKYYIRQLDHWWEKTKTGTIENFISANDIQDISTILHFSIGASLVFISYGIAMFYAYKTLRVVQRPFGNQALSRNTRSLTRQFTRNLFIQTVVTQIFAVLPSTYIAFYLVARPNFSSGGPFTSSLFAWNPAANALVTLSVVRPYRSYIFRLLGIKWLSRRIRSTGDTSNLMNRKNSVATTSNVYSMDSNQNCVLIRTTLIDGSIPRFSKISMSKTSDL